MARALIRVAGYGAVLGLALGCGASSHGHDDDDTVAGADGDSDADADGEADADADGEADADADGEADADADGEADADADGDDSDDAGVAGERDGGRDAGIDASEPDASAPIGDCCEPIGEQFELTGEEGGGSGFDLAWNEDGWGVVWGPIVFRALDAQGVPLGPPVVIEGRRDTFFDDLEWTRDHYAVITSDEQAANGAEIRILDGSGALEAGPTSLGVANNSHIKWHSGDSRWIVAYMDVFSSDIYVRAVDQAAQLDGPPVFVAAHGRPPRVVEAGGLTTVAWRQRDGIWFRSFEGLDVDGGAAPYQVVNGSGPSWLDVTNVGARVALIHVTSGDVVVTKVDPSTREIVAGPEVVGQTGIVDRRPVIAAAGDHGEMGVCYMVGTGRDGGGGGEPPPPEGLTFAFLADDATVVGEPLILAEDPIRIGPCALGWSGDEFVVAWFENDQRRIMAQRMGVIR